MVWWWIGLILIFLFIIRVIFFTRAESKAGREIEPLALFKRAVEVLDAERKRTRNGASPSTSPQGAASRAEIVHIQAEM